MSIETYNLKIALILAVGFSFASALGYFTNRIRLSPILGYLIAGYFIGPYFPGFVADKEISEQLAEVGVILMMFGVGLHFKWQDLMNVRNVALPGAIVQTVLTTLVVTLVFYLFGWRIESGFIIGFAVAVASTVVMVRVLTDNKMLHTLQGHIAVGWLIVEDLFTVFLLLILPILPSDTSDSNNYIIKLLTPLPIILLKFAVLTFLVFTIGRKLVEYTLLYIARTRSHELFTVAVLAWIFVIAIGSAQIFGTSFALGAFLAGMVIGRTDVRHQAFAQALPLTDVFVVIFFLSVGMLFDPNAITQNFLLFVLVSLIIILMKPLIAFIFILVIKYPIKVALTVALALAQIGEFSFILAQQAMNYQLLPDAGYDIIVASALFSLAINPILFRLANPLGERLEKWLSGIPVVASKVSYSLNQPRAIVVGFGPIGQRVSEVIEKMGYIVTVIEKNVDTISRLRRSKYEAIYGDASNANILDAAKIKEVQVLVLTIPDIEYSIHAIKTAKQLNPNVYILARAQYTKEEHLLEELDVDFISAEEEAVQAFRRALMQANL